MLKSMPKSKNRYFYHILVYPGDAPGAITLNVVWMKVNSMLTNCLAKCAHLTVSEIQRDICEKIVILSCPLAFDAPVIFPPTGRAILFAPINNFTFIGAEMRKYSP